MGMYDYIDFRYQCPKCKEWIYDFQSKDGDCEFETLRFDEVENFYAICHPCNIFIEFTTEEVSITHNLRIHKMGPGQEEILLQGVSINDDGDVSPCETYFENME